MAVAINEELKPLPGYRVVDPSEVAALEQQGATTGLLPGYQEVDFYPAPPEEEAPQPAPPPAPEEPARWLPTEVAKGLIGGGVQRYATMGKGWEMAGSLAGIPPVEEAGKAVRDAAQATYDAYFSPNKASSWLAQGAGRVAASVSGMAPMIAAGKFGGVYAGAAVAGFDAMVGMYDAAQTEGLGKLESLDRALFSGGVSALLTIPSLGWLFKKLGPGFANRILKIGMQSGIQGVIGAVQTAVDDGLLGADTGKMLADAWASVPESLAVGAVMGGVHEAFSGRGKKVSPKPEVDAVKEAEDVALLEEDFAKQIRDNERAGGVIERTKEKIGQEAEWGAAFDTTEEAKAIKNPRVYKAARRSFIVERRKEARQTAKEAGEEVGEEEGVPVSEDETIQPEEEAAARDLLHDVDIGIDTEPPAWVEREVLDASDVRGNQGQSVEEGNQVERSQDTGGEDIQQQAGAGQGVAGAEQQAPREIEPPQEAPFTPPEPSQAALSEVQAPPVVSAPVQTEKPPTGPSAKTTTPAPLPKGLRFRYNQVKAVGERVLNWYGHTDEIVESVKRKNPNFDLSKPDAYVDPDFVAEIERMTPAFLESERIRREQAGESLDYNQMQATAFSREVANLQRDLAAHQALGEPTPPREVSQVAQNHADSLHKPVAGPDGSRIEPPSRIAGMVRQEGPTGKTIEHPILGQPTEQPPTTARFEEYRDLADTSPDSLARKMTQIAAQVRQEQRKPGSFPRAVEQLQSMRQAAQFALDVHREAGGESEGRVRRLNEAYQKTHGVVPEPRTVYSKTQEKPFIEEVEGGREEAAKSNIKKLDQELKKRGVNPALISEDTKRGWFDPDVKKRGQMPTHIEDAVNEIMVKSVPSEIRDKLAWAGEAAKDPNKNRPLTREEARQIRTLNLIAGEKIDAIHQAIAAVEESVPGFLGAQNTREVDLSTLQRRYDHAKERGPVRVIIDSIFETAQKERETADARLKRGSLSPADHAQYLKDIAVLANPEAIDKMAHLAWVRAESWASQNGRPVSEYWLEGPDVAHTPLGGPQPKIKTRLQQITEGVARGFTTTLDGRMRQIRLHESGRLDTLLEELAHTWQEDGGIGESNMPALSAWINKEGRTFVQRERRDVWDKLTSAQQRGSDPLLKKVNGVWDWSEGASEAWAILSKRLLSDPKYAGEAPVAIRETLKKLQDWIGTYIGAFVRGGVLTPTEQVRRAYYKGFTVTEGQIRGNATTKAQAMLTISRAMRNKYDPMFLWHGEHSKILAPIFDHRLVDKYGTDEAGWADLWKQMQAPDGVSTLIDRTLAIHEMPGATLTHDLFLFAQLMAGQEINNTTEKLLSSNYTDAESKSMAGKLVHDGSLFWNKVVSQAQTDLGGTLRLNQIDQLAHVQAILLNAQATLGRELNKSELHTLHQQIQDVKDGKPFARERLDETVKALPDPRLKDYFRTVIYGSLLGGSSVQVKNGLFNFMMYGMKSGERSVVGALDAATSLFTGKQRQFFAKEGLLLLTGGENRAGWKMAREYAKYYLMHAKDHPDYALIRAEGEYGQGGEKLGINPKSAMAFRRNPNKWIRYPGFLFEYGQLALHAVDTFFQTIGFEGQRSALEYRKRKLIERGDTTNPYANLSVEDIRKSSILWGRLITANDSPGGVTQSALNLKHNMGIVGDAGIPFVNTIANLFKRGLEYTPGVGLGMEAINRGNLRHVLEREARSELAPLVKAGQLVENSRAYLDAKKVTLARLQAENKGKNPQNMYLAAWQEIFVKQAVGAAASVLLLSMFGDKDENGLPRLTGAMPTDPTMRAEYNRLHLQPYSYRIDKPGGGYLWFRYDRFDALGLPLMFAADGWKAWQATKDLDPRDPMTEKKRTDILGGMAREMGAALVGNTFLQGPLKLLDPNQPFSQKAQQAMGPLEPASSLRRTIAQQWSSARNKGHPLQADTTTVAGFMYQVLPILGEAGDAAGWWSVPHKISLFGEERTINNSSVMYDWLPFGAPGGPDKLDVEMLSNLKERPSFLYPEKSVSLYPNRQDVPIPHEIWVKANLLYGAEVKERLLKVIETPAYQSLGDDARGVGRRSMMLGNAAKPIQEKWHAKVRLELRKQYPAQGVPLDR